MSSHIAYFISAHGYGHAARACAVLLALKTIQPDLTVDIYTQVPLWMFENSLKTSFRYYEIFTDVGVAQVSAMQEDLPETVRRLESFLPFDQEIVAGLASDLLDRQTCLAVCDISPLGIAAAHSAGIPSVLVENFTWDWIYSGYLTLEPRLQASIDLMRAAFRQPDYHIQTRPFCSPPLSQVDLVVSPVARIPRTPKTEIRNRLEIPEGARSVLVTMGGIRQNYGFLERLPDRPDIFFIVPGVTDVPDFHRNLRLLPHHSDFYHPDLLAASDAVVGKVGYSTLSEAYHANVPFGYVAREKLRESDCLRRFVEEEMACQEIHPDQFETGVWAEDIDRLFQLTRPHPAQENGAHQVARFLSDQLTRIR